MRALLRLLAPLLLASPLLASPLLAQTEERAVATAARGPHGEPGRGDAVPARASATAASAVRAFRAPVIDGREGDEVWETAQVIDAFRQTEPTIGKETSFRTEARVAYDAGNLYVLVRAHDPEPSRIQALLSRRDVRTQSDYVRVMVDSYRDRRTGYQFMLNPAGVQRDLYIFNDGNEDLSWDAVWEGKSTIDAKGWVAEFRIPLSMLRFAAGEENTFGLMIMREVARSGERDTWPLWDRSQPGLPSQFGTLDGFRGLGAARRLELTPYSVTKSVTAFRGDAYASSAAHPTEQTIGADLKWGVTSNFTIDATVNPDFGQVEADPGMLNLSAFEQFFPERRPFFVEGMGILRFDLGCNDGACSSLFYPRRVGRAPSLNGVYDGAQQFTAIRAAAKLSGRTQRGLSVGMLSALTDDATGALGETTEPTANYNVLRLQQETKSGNSGLGLMLTGINRFGDEFTSPFLREAAYTGGIDARHRFGGNRYQVSGNLAASTVSGSAESIWRTQRSAVHLYQRPDAGLGVDSGATRMNGYMASAGFQRIGGGILRYSTFAQYTSPGFEVNDVGFIPRVDQAQWGNWVGLQFQTPRSFYRRMYLNANQWNGWTSNGLPTSRGMNVGGFTELRNFVQVNAGAGVSNVGSVFDDRAARGGPALRRSPEVFGWWGISGDHRAAVRPGVGGFMNRYDDGRSWSWNVGPRVDLRWSSRVQGMVGASFNSRHDDAMWYGNVGVSGLDTTHYTFAALRQKTLSLTTRLDVTATPTLSLQLYAQPFVTSGEYSDHRELADPRAARYDDRFRRYGERGSFDGFNYKQFRSNTVVRWEYRPGSTLFLVWAQGRGDGRDPATFSARRDLGNLFRTMPDNTFLLKASYWFSL